MVIYNKLKNMYSLRKSKKIDDYVIRYLNENEDPRQLIDKFSHQSNSTGVSNSDYVVLFEYVKKNIFSKIVDNKLESIIKHI